MDEQRRTHLDLFSGIGGFALAAKWAGFDTVAFCECEPYAKRVLRKNFPAIPIIDDIHELDGRDFRGCRLVSGGFPCQPFSHAGVRRGEADHRSLWREMARVVSQCQPTWILAENVAGLATMGLDDVLADLEGMGYEMQTFSVGAVSVGARHHRPRLWIVGRVRDVSDSDGGRREEQRQPEPIQSNEQRQAAILEPERGSRATRRQPESWGWQTEPDFRRVAHGIPSRVDRLRGLGNAICPAVAYEFLRLMT